jgi:hypothetical protein
MSTAASRYDRHIADSIYQLAVQIAFLLCLLSFFFAPLNVLETWQRANRIYCVSFPTEAEDYGVER